jgi:peptidoglycan/LPS O-acetylase OafA/YrhL
MKRKRYFEIDFLKAVSALAVILIHVSGTYKSTASYINTIWVWSHFAVGSFVVASGFLLARHNDTLTKWSDLWVWFKKRFVRLVGPYLVYVTIHASLIILVPSIFDRIEIEPSVTFTFNTIFLHSGFGQNWIPRLFILLSVSYMIIQLVRSKLKLSSNFYVVVFLLSVGLSAIFLLPSLEFTVAQVKYVQTATWLALMLFGMILFGKKDTKRWVVGATITTGVVFFTGYLLLPMLDISSSVFAHKYPPTLYFLAFNIFVTLVLYLIAHNSEKILVSNKFLAKPICFLSRHSYTIFFAHVLVMDVFEKPTGFWLTDYILITTLTVLAVIAWMKGVNIIRSRWNKGNEHAKQPQCP